MCIIPAKDPHTYQGLINRRRAFIHRYVRHSQRLTEVPPICLATHSWSADKTGLQLAFPCLSTVHVGPQRLARSLSLHPTAPSSPAMVSYQDEFQLDCEEQLSEEREWQIAAPDRCSQDQGRLRTLLSIEGHVACHPFFNTVQKGYMSPKDRDETLEYMYQVSPRDNRAICDPPHARTTWGTACSALCIQPVYSLFVPPRTQLLFRGDWMEQFQIAVSFLDRYLARNATERHELRGIALGCILMAAKVNGDELSVQEIAKIGCMHYRRVKVGCKKTSAILDSCYLAGNLKVTCVWLPSCTELREEGWGWSRMGWHRRHSTGTY